MPLVFAADSQQNWWLCDQPKDPGPCYAHIPRYYYDSSSGQCEEFIYGGCLGNSNRFVTQKECEQACVQAMAESICDLSLESGHCSKHFLRYYFNSKTGQCEEFVYTGCGGNDNRFSTKQKCEQACKKAICTLPQDTGPCLPLQKFERYYFNSKTGRCETFMYGGCHGNENRFSTKQECEQECNRKVICALPMETGPCEENVPSFHFYSKNGQCERFTYSGCGGNNNRFSSKRDCEVVCGKKKHLHPAPES